MNIQYTQPSIELSAKYSNKFKANFAKLNVIFSPKPKVEKPDCNISTNIKTTSIFELISLVKFKRSHAKKK